MKNLRRAVSHVIHRAALGLLLPAVVAASCVPEPEGIRPMESSDGQGIATAGHSFDDGASRLACEGFAIVRAKCARCHADPPEHGAPFSLTMPEDLELLDRQGVTRRWRMAEAIERGRMPARYVELEPPVEELSDEERELLLTWLRADGPDAATNCD